MNKLIGRKLAIGVLSVALLNTGMMHAASAAIIETPALLTTDREADLGAIRAHLDKVEVREQMAQLGVDPAMVEQRLARLGDRELHALAVDMRNAPAGGDSALALVGGVFVVLLILELVGVIDIFKKT